MIGKGGDADGDNSKRSLNDPPCAFFTFACLVAGALQTGPRENTCNYPGEYLFTVLIECKRTEMIKKTIKEAFPARQTSLEGEKL